MRTTFANAVSACSELLTGDRALGCQGLPPLSRLPLRWAGLDLNQRLTDYESRQRVSGRFGLVG